MLTTTTLTPATAHFTAVHYADTDDGWSGVEVVKNGCTVALTPVEAQQLSAALAKVSA